MLSDVFTLPDIDPDNIFRNPLPGDFPVDHGKEANRDYFMQIGLRQPIEPFPPDGGLTAPEYERTVVGQFQRYPYSVSDWFDHEVELPPVTLFRLYQEPP